MYMIDPPTDFDTRERWQRYLEEIRLLLLSDPESEQLQEAEQEALDFLENGPQG